VALSILRIVHASVEPMMSLGMAAIVPQCNALCNYRCCVSHNKNGPSPK
jgi:hypothetical protein